MVRLGEVKTFGISQEDLGGISLGREGLGEEGKSLIRFIINKGAQVQLLPQRVLSGGVGEEK